MQFLIESAVAAVAFTLLAVLWHLCGFAPMPEPGPYVYTEFFATCYSAGFFAAVLIVAAGLARVVEAQWSLALGFVLPLALAMAMEVVRNPTSHNLLPFEIVLGWAPLFAVAAVGGRAGKMMWRKLKSA